MDYYRVEESSPVANGLVTSCFLQVRTELIGDVEVERKILFIESVSLFTDIKQGRFFSTHGIRHCCIHQGWDFAFHSVGAGAGTWPYFPWR